MGDKMDDQIIFHDAPDYGSAKITDFVIRKRKIMSFTLMGCCYAAHVATRLLPHRVFCEMLPDVADKTEFVQERNTYVEEELTGHWVSIRGYDTGYTNGVKIAKERNGITFMFELVEDAVLFKLRWG